MDNLSLYHGFHPPVIWRSPHGGTCCVVCGYSHLKREKMLPRLTKTELNVANLLIQGLSNKQIGENLFVCEKTVKFHMTNIMRKLGTANRTHAALKWYKIRNNGI